MAKRCEICGAPLLPDEVRGNARRCSICGSRERFPVHPSPSDRRADSAAPRPAGTTSIVIEGKYRLEEELGRGAMGTVFAAQDVALRRRVAIKFLLPELAGSKEYAERFQHEAVGMASIHHNNVAQIYAYGQHGGLPYFVMEYLEGQTVDNLVQSFNRRGFFLSLDLAFDIIIQCLDGLCAIHQSGAVHRDLKPGNILLTGEPPRAVIMDFGLVRMVQMEEDVRAMAGTPAYIAPELIEGQDGASRSPSIDLYSMGVTAYEIITGSLPFGGETWVEILRKHITELPPFPSDKRPGLGEGIDRVLMRALSKDPRERHRSADELLADFLELRATLALSPPKRRGSMLPSFSPAPVHRPSSAPKPYRPAAESQRESNSGSGVLRVLVADQNEDFRTMVHRVTKTIMPKCRVQSAANGQTALRLVEDFRPHLIVLCLDLGEVNGLEVIGMVRGEPKLSSAKILVAIGHNERHRDETILRSMGVEHFLTKPIDEDELHEVIDFILRDIADLQGLPAAH